MFLLGRRKGSASSKIRAGRNSYQLAGRVSTGKRAYRYQYLQQFRILAEDGTLAAHFGVTAMLVLAG